MLERIVRDDLPPEVRIGYQGQSKEFKDASSAIYITFALALLVVFLVLAAQFESWINPFIIMLTVPLAVTGGLLALCLTGQIAQHLQPDRHDPAHRPDDQERHPDRRVRQPAARARLLKIRDAVVEASVLRLRPILMTSIATMGGAMPLAWSTGAGRGGAQRHRLGHRRRRRRSRPC